MTPQLRFPEFTDEWQVKKLGDFSSITTGKLDANAMVEDGRYRFYTCAREFYKIDQYAFDTEALLVSGNGANVGYIHYYKGKFNAYQRTYVLDNFRENIGYIKLYLDRYLKKRILQEKFEGNMPYIVLSTLKDMPISTPPTKEQEKIADFLTAVDERIAVDEKKLELLETYKRGVMQKIFSQQVRFKDDNGNPYPDWEEKKLGEIGETYNGLTGKSGDDFGIGANFITYMQIFSDSRISQNFGKVRINPGEKQNTVEYGDIFFTTSSETPEETGYTSVLLNNPSDTYLNSFCFGYRADKNILSPEFARYLFHSSNVRSSIIRLAQGSTRYNISKVQMMKMTIAIPTKEEQQKIATFLTALDDKIKTEQTRLTAAKQWKKGLLQRMFI